MTHYRTTMTDTKPTIWKYNLKLIDEQIVKIPPPTRFLSVAIQDGQIAVWVVVKPDAPPEPVHFTIRGTGHALTGAEGEYVGTVQDHGLVWHIFAANFNADRSNYRRLDY